MENKRLRCYSRRALCVLEFPEQKINIGYNVRYKQNRVQSISHESRDHAKQQLMVK